MSKSHLLVCAALLVSACTPAGLDDAGAHDDAGSADAGAEDGGPRDAGGSDGGVVDGGPLDAGFADAGFDAGPPPPEVDAGPPTDAGAAFWDGLPSDLEDDVLVAALRARLVEVHVALDYAALLGAYLDTDTGRGACTGIFDFYSSSCWSAGSSCGNYDEEGDCYNREHTWPKSWWGGSESIDAYTDLVAVVPADGYVNNLRGNLPLGDVSAPSYLSSNGSKVGACVSAGLSGNCFEPPDELKGDLARIYFYMAVRYQGELACCSVAAVDGADLNAPTEALLRAWHAYDPVDADERARNDAVAELQGSRNPFVDYPAWLARIADL